MDLATANTYLLALAPLVAGLALVSLGRGRFALEGQTPAGAWVYVESRQDAVLLLKGGVR